MGHLQLGNLRPKDAAILGTQSLLKPMADPTVGEVKRFPGIHRPELTQTLAKSLPSQISCLHGTLLALPAGGPSSARGSPSEVSKETGLN